MNRINRAALGAMFSGLLFSTLSLNSLADLPEPNADGISTGHTHFNVPNVAMHKEIWKMFGATEVSSNNIQLLSIPGMYFLLNESEPTAPSGDSSVNHIGFSVNNYEQYKAKLAAIGATIVVDNVPNLQILADLPDGVRVEFFEITDQEEPIVFHHTHLAASEGEQVRQWYVDVFGAEAGERNGMIGAVIPGGRVDLLGAGETTPVATQGTAIDHIGFEVADMDAFARKMASLGIEFDRGPETIEAVNLTIAFITDPVGTYIEITEGLADIE